MFLRKPVAGFLWRFILVFALLAVPWPGMRERYGDYLVSASRAVLSSDDGRRELTFETIRERPRGGVDARVVIVNRDLLAEDGSGPVRNLDVALGTLGAQSVALLVALICATPVSWRQRGLATLFGLLLLHLCVFGLLKFSIWTESSEVQLVSLSPGFRDLTHSLETALLAQFNIAVPVLLWIAVTFRAVGRSGVFERAHPGNKWAVAAGSG